MKNLMKIGLFAILLNVSQLFTSCTTQKLLIANFESDTVGSLPDQSLPGDPVGDRMTCYQSESAAYSGAYRVIEKPRGTTGEIEKWLQIIGNLGSPTEARIVQFIPKRGTLVDPVYTVGWEGAILHPGADSKPFNVSFYSGAFASSQLFFSLTFKRETNRGEEVSSIYLNQNGRDDEDSELIGQVRPDVPHSIAVHINAEARTYTVKGSGLPNNIEKAIPSSITNVREPRIWMSYSLEGVGVYQINNMDIVEGKSSDD